MTRVVFLLLVLLWTWQREAARPVAPPQAAPPAPRDAGTRAAGPKSVDAAPAVAPAGDDRLAGKPGSPRGAQESQPEPGP